MSHLHKLPDNKPSSFITLRIKINSSFYIYKILPSNKHNLHNKNRIKCHCQFFLPMITVKSVVTELVSYPDLLNPQREHLVKSIFACIMCVGNLTHGTTVHVQDLKRKKWRENVKRCSTIRTKKKRTSFSKWRDPQGRNTISNFIATDFCKNLFEFVLNVAQNIHHVC